MKLKDRIHWINLPRYDGYRLHDGRLNCYRSNPQQIDAMEIILTSLMDHTLICLGDVDASDSPRSNAKSIEKHKQACGSGTTDGCEFLLRRRVVRQLRHADRVARNGNRDAI